MASIDTTIVLIALPAIFRGINIDPFSSFQYMLWILFGYSIVTATLLVTFGRLSDMFGRVKLYNLGFAIFTIGSILLSITPNQGDTGAIELIVFRIVQGIGGAFLFANSAAIITDAFPSNERGKALGINQISSLAGSLIGLVLGWTFSHLQLETCFFGKCASWGSRHRLVVFEAERAMYYQKKPEIRHLGEHCFRRRLNVNFSRSYLWFNTVWKLSNGLG
jgi:MFS family permease